MRICHVEAAYFNVIPFSKQWYT